MSKEQVTKESLQDQLFEALKTNEQVRNQEILTACEVIAMVTVNLPQNPSPEELNLYNTTYKYQLKQLDLNVEALQKISTIINDSFPEHEYEKIREVINAPFEEKNIIWQAEVENKKKDLNKDPKFKAVKDMLRDKGVAHQNDFSKKGAKQDGVSAGYIAQEEVSGNTFILKQFYKSHADCLALDDEKQQQALSDRRDGVQELIGSSLYQLLLYDRAPKEELVKPNLENPNSLFVRSKFFNNAEQFSTFSGSPKTFLEGNKKELQKLEGFEKVIAACHMLGEIDYHAGNLMVQDGKTVTKIDHGRSFVEFHQDFPAMIQSTYKSFNYFGYDDAIEKGDLSFSVEKYSDSLKQMIMQLDEKAIDAIVDQRIAELQQVDFNPAGIIVAARFQGNNQKVTSINNFDELKQCYKENIKENLTNMKEVAKSAEIVSKFSSVSPAFKQGQWLESFAYSQIQDPVAYAANYDIEIEGKNALQWAHDNNYQIKVPTAPITEVVQEQQWQKNADNKWQQVEVAVSKTRKTTTSLDPVEYIVSEKDKKKLQLSKSETEFLTQATALDITSISGKTYKSMVENSEVAKDILSQEYKQKMHDQYQVVGDKLIPVIDNFVNKTLNKEVQAEQVEQFYDKLLTHLKAGNYLTKEDVNSIKQEQDYKDNIKETVRLINIKAPDLTGGDKVCYKVANFCQKIGLSDLSNYFMKKITPGKLDKIHKVENVLTESLEISKIFSKSKDSKEGIQTKILEEVKKVTQSGLEARRAKQQRGRA
ncbi:T4SS effector phosphatidylinositol 3-Kinase RisK1 [Rickettsia endosymbiont of Oedothorax gibbosus]|uniref:T4SS effector phosphatidylinositol 3-Kinase RisK1 n=1 Tax=Rickettsia endosymbiont of Oedothorax gibbosus TaxID=931099 RepID=UPI002024BA80|nr:phosphatidylinositol 4-kinase [Rickettsia endosymbiont of Oedothorax gibbosus]